MISPYIRYCGDRKHALPVLLVNARFQGISQSYVQQWLSLAVSSDNSHLLGNFGNESPSGVMYNLFADKLLQLGLIPQSVS